MPTPGYLTDEEYRFVYSRAPRLCVDLVIGLDDEIVLSMRDIPPEKGLWHLPGGRVRHRESVVQAASRIAENELGISIELGDFLGYIEFLYEGEFVHTVSLVFRARQTGGTLRGSEQAGEVKVFRKIPPNTHPQQKTFLKNNLKIIQKRVA